MDIYTIRIEDLRCEVIIGLLEFERQNPQPVVAECELDYLREGDAYVDYAVVAKLIKEMLQKGKYLLIEDALTEIIEAIRHTFPALRRIRLKLCKPQILADCNVCVEKAIKY